MPPDLGQQHHRADELTSNSFPGFPSTLPLSLSSSSRSSGPASWWMLSDSGFLSFSDSLLVFTMEVQLRRATSPALSGKQSTLICRHILVCARYLATNWQQNQQNPTQHPVVLFIPSTLCWCEFGDIGCAFS